MNLAIPTYSLEPPLPLWLRLRLSVSRIIRLAHISQSNSPSSQYSLEQQFRDTIARENTTISKICFSYASSIADYEDLRQDALINIWRGMKSFRGEASTKTWIYRVTVNSCLTTIRRQNRHNHESLDQLYSIIDDEDDSREAIEQMHTIISRLGLQERAIIMMWLDEMSYDEIAAAMGSNRNTIATKIRRTKEKIYKQYKLEENL